MLKFCSLYSGSTGNSLYIKSDKTEILIDAGVSMKKISEALDTLDTNFENISALLVTHEHTDHINSIDTISRKYNIPIYANKGTWEAMPKKALGISDENRKIFDPYKSFKLSDIKIEPFRIPHDAADPCGFNLYNKKTKISLATDLGHMPSDVIKFLENSSFLMLESNYDPEVLRLCSYPYMLKSRISGPNGHLSNSMAGTTICSLIDKGLKNVMLGHLSKENNFPELAYKTVMDELRNNNFEENSIALDVASRICPSKLIDVS